MGVSLSIGRNLLARTPPTIVITEPLPRWQAWAQRVLRLLGLLLACALSFLGGMYYQQERTPVRHADIVVQPSEPAAAESAAKQPAAAAVPRAQELLEPRVVEGLTIQSLEVANDATAPGQLRYQFTVSNEGRLYEGQMEFAVLGQLEGRQVLWTFPSTGERPEARYQMRIGRYIKSEGRLQLPPGLTPQVVALRLRETGGVRASRGVQLPEAVVVRGR